VSKPETDRTALRIKDFEVYMPAKDFELSKRFYTAVGFQMSERHRRLRLNGCRSVTGPFQSGVPTRLEPLLAQLELSNLHCARRRGGYA
jgi:hypothetical protein